MCYPQYIKRGFSCRNISFASRMQNKDIETELEAWLTALTTRSLARIDELICKFPDFADIYREIFEFRTRPEELIHMYSKVLAAADRNMDRMMIDEMQEEIEKLSREIAEKKQALADSNAALADSNAALADSNAALADSNAALADSNAALAKQLSINEELTAKLASLEKK